MEHISKISDILSESFFNKDVCLSSVKKATAFGFWKDITGSRFSNFSMPYDIKGSTLFVAVKNPQVMQELIFYKNNILSKSKNYFSPLGYNINEIRYDYKIWNKINSSDEVIGDNSLEDIDIETIEKTDLTPIEQKEISKVTDTISNYSFMTDEQKNRFKRNIINSIKAKKVINSL